MLVRKNDDGVYALLPCCRHRFEEAFQSRCVIPTGNKPYFYQHDTTEINGHYGLHEKSTKIVAKQYVGTWILLKGHYGLFINQQMK
jgi:hypothetical protein